MEQMEQTEKTRTLVLEDDEHLCIFLHCPKDGQRCEVLVYKGEYGTSTTVKSPTNSKVIHASIYSENDNR